MSNTPEAISKAAIPIIIPVICRLVIFSRKSIAAKSDARKITEPLNTGKKTILGISPVRLILSLL